jgi:hypothetical protein
MAGIGGFATKINGSEDFQNFNTNATSVSELNGDIRHIVTVVDPEISMTDIDVSSMDSAQNYMEFIGGSKDPGQIDVIVNYSSDDFDEILDAFGEDNQIWTVSFPDESSLSVDGYLNKLGAGTAGTNEKLTRSVGIKCSGTPTHNATFVLPPANNTNL